MEKKLKGVCFGEILIDVFGKVKKIGGAPLNVASRLSSLGVNMTMISSVGNDIDGKILLKFASDSNINIHDIQVSNQYPTGLVDVQLNNKGNATYNIKYPSAWDKIEITPENINTVQNADFLIYGSLSSRDLISGNTLKHLLKVAKFKIFDVNLRSPFYNLQMILDLAKEANFLKFNDDELFEICTELNSETKSLEQNIKFISRKTKTESVCVTMGAHGAVLYYNEKFYYNSGFHVKVVDTVGSGDSFLAALINMLFQNKNPQYAITYACAIGSIVAQSEGANPIISQEEIDSFLNGF